MNKVALITGGSRGIGYGIVKNLAERGFDIAFNGIRPAESVQDIVKDIKKTGVDAIYCQGNIALKEDRMKILNQVKAHYKKLHILVNNAGIAPKERSDILTANEQSFDELISVNLKGNYFLTQAVANWMIEQKKADPHYSACIINISSISATVASVNRGDYCISKAGISMATRLFAVRLGEYEIPVFEVRPGVIDTDMTSGVKEKYNALIENGLCIQGRWGTPDDVGKVVGAIAGGDFPYSTGQVFLVDGGLTIPRL